jgi:hypothetical protein
LINKNHKVSIYIDIQSEHNDIILSGIIKHINYMFRPSLGHHQVVPSLLRNCITYSAYLMGYEILFLIRYADYVIQLICKLGTT